MLKNPPEQQNSNHWIPRRVSFSSHSTSLLHHSSLNRNIKHKKTQIECNTNVYVCTQWILAFSHAYFSWTPKRCYIPKGMHFNFSFIWDMFCNVQSDTCRPKRSPNIKSFFAPREQSRWDSQRDSPQSYSVWLHWTAVFVAQSTVQWRNRRKEKCFKSGWLSNLKMVNNEYSFKFKSFATNRVATFK